MKCHMWTVFIILPIKIFTVNFSFKAHVWKEFTLGCTAQLPVVTPRGCKYLQIVVCVCWFLQLSWTPQMVSQMDVFV